jgi:peptide subunit release factor 1 (eRF1)
MADYIAQLFIAPKQRYGVVQIYGEDSVIQVCDETLLLRTLGHKSTKLQRRHGRGGQSQNRIARLRDESIHEYLKSVAEKITTAFMTNSQPNVSDILILGHGLKKQQIIEYLPNMLAQIPIIVESKPQADPVEPFIRRFVESRACINLADDLNKIEDIMQQSPDLLVFGDEIVSHAADIKTIYDAANVVARYGGPVGVRYYAESQI